MLEHRLGELIRQVDDLEKRFTALSGRQSVIQVAARDGLADAERRIDLLESTVERERAQGRRQAQQLQDLLARLVDDTREITSSAKRLG